MLSFRFFGKSAMEFKERITRYRSTMEEIGKQLSTIDNRNDHSPELISNVILNQHSTFMSLASNVANLHSELEQLKKDYTQWYQVSGRRLM
jgi:nucleoporin p58/p45